MNIENMSIDELVREAEHTDDKLALAIVENTIDESEETIHELIVDTAQYLAGEINEKIQDYIDSYYLNPESDYFDWLYEIDHFAGNGEYIRAALMELLDSGDIDESTHDSAIEHISAIIDALSIQLDYVCNVVITRNYAAPGSLALGGGSIGEIQEETEHLIDIPNIYVTFDAYQEKLISETYLAIDAGYIPADRQGEIYFDLTDCFASLVLDPQNFIELINETLSEV